MEKDDLEWSEVKRPHFFKVLCGDFKNSLRIPPRFVKNLTDENEQKTDTSNLTAMLEGPSGKIWHVKIETMKNDMYFTSGWRKFVDDHILEEHEFLVFKYNLNLHFSVLVFDISACEKEVFRDVEMEASNENGESQVRENEDLAAQQGRDKEKNEEKNRSREPSGCEIISNRVEREEETKEVNYEEIMKLAKDCESLATKKRPKDFDLESFLVDKRKKSSEAKTLYDVKIEKECVNEIGTSSPDSNPTTNKDGNIKTPSPKKNSKIDKEVEEISLSEMPVQTRSCFRSYYGQLKAEDNSKALKAALSFQSKFPSVVIHMSKYTAYRSNHLRIPKDFSMKYMPKEKSEFVLRDPFGKEWDALFLPYNGLMDRLSRGWTAFRKGILIKPDDWCVFELVKKNEFRVHIFRSGD